MTVDPGWIDQLKSKFDKEEFRSRQVELPTQEDTHEAMFERSWTDGLPVVPPTPQRVRRMLEGTSRDADEIVVLVPPNLVECTVEKIAVNAVMAGCKPEFLPVVIAALEAICTEEFNMHGVLATTMSVGPIFVVNGPIADEIGMNSEINVLGHGNRANSTIGRAVQLVILNVGGGGPGSANTSEAYEGMKVNVYPENKNPATLLGSSAQVRIVDIPPNEIWAKMVNFGTGSYLNTTNTNGGNLTNGFDIKDFTVPSELNGVTARIYIGVKANGNTKNLHDFGIGGLQILDLTQPLGYNQVLRAMAIRGLPSEQTWVTKSNPLNYETSAGYFETSSTFNVTSGFQEFPSLNTVKNYAYHSLNFANIYAMSTSNNFVNGRFNVTGFQNFGTPTEVYKIKTKKEDMGRAGGEGQARTLTFPLL